MSQRGQTVAGYNVQIAVDSQNQLLVCSDVVNDGNDTQPLAPIAIKAKETLEVEHLTVDADTGYDDREPIKAGVDAGMTPYVPLADKEAQPRKAGHFVRSEWTFDADSYRCPAGNPLNRQSTLKKGGKVLWKYASKASVCAKGELRNKWLPKQTGYRQLDRWEHEHLIDEHQQRMKETGHEHMKTRASLAKHPFGTMKNNRGWQHFLMRGLDKVRAKMNLPVLTYHFKRVLNLMGMSAFTKPLKPRIMAYKGHQSLFWDK